MMLILGRSHGAEGHRHQERLDQDTLCWWLHPAVQGQVQLLLQWDGAGAQGPGHC